MTVILKPTTELVAVAWIKGVEGISSSAVGTTLPSDDTWADTGFVQVTAVGGSREMNIPVARPAVRLLSWAFSGTSKKPQWGKANNALELIWQGCQADNAIRTVELPGDFPAVRVIGSQFIGEPQRRPDDPGSYAVYYVDLTLHWVEA
jgi:hypothetical protein